MNTWWRLLIPRWAQINKSRMRLVSINTLLPPVAAAQEGAGGGLWAGLVWNTLPEFHPYLCLSLQQEHSWHRPAETESTKKTESFPKQWVCILPQQPMATEIVGIVTMVFQKCFSTEPALKKPDTQFSTKPPLISMVQIQQGAYGCP